MLTANGQHLAISSPVSGFSTGKRLAQDNLETFMLMDKFKKQHWSWIQMMWLTLLQKKNAFLTHTNLAHMNVYLNNNLWGSKMKPILRCQNTAVPWMSNWGWLQKSVNTTSFFLHTVTCLFKWRLKVLQATQEWKWIHHVHSPLPMESWVKFCSPQKISGASRQKRLAALF